LVELMGGTLWFESTPGLGSTFRFTLGSDWVASGPRRFLPGARTDLKGLRILVVDDNATNRRILANLAAKWGAVATLHESGPVALAALADGARFDLAILDMQMPDMDGLMLARALREHPHGSFPLLLLSSIGHHFTEADLTPFATVLTKPAKPAQLFDALARIASPAPAPAEPVTAPLPPLPAQQRDEIVLLAEDNLVNQKVALHLLARLGYRADLVNNGLEALAALKRRNYDIILMDVQMPEMDGMEASRRIKAAPPVAGVRPPWIIALTANAMEGDREKCLEAGMDDYLMKPIRTGDLIAVLDRARAHAAAKANETNPAPSA
jgi:CheY-like chemotaxis protein